MYNTILQSSLLLIGGNPKTIRFEANMLRSLGVKSVRGIFDVEEYLKTRPPYPIDALLIHEDCALFSGIEFIKKMRFEFSSQIPMILIFSSSPSVHILQTLESISAVSLVRPYARRDIQRALVQAKRILHQKEAFEEHKNSSENTKNPTKSTPEEQQTLLTNRNNTFLLTMIHFQFFLRTGEIENAVNSFTEMKDLISTKRFLSLLERTAKETQNPTNTIQQFCKVLEAQDNGYAKEIYETLLVNTERKAGIKKLSQRNSRNITDNKDLDIWKYIQ